MILRTGVSTSVSTSILTRVPSTQVVCSFSPGSELCWRVASHQVQSCVGVFPACYLCFTEALSALCLDGLLKRQQDLHPTFCFCWQIKLLPLLIRRLLLIPPSGTTFNQHLIPHSRPNSAPQCVILRFLDQFLMNSSGIRSSPVTGAAPAAPPLPPFF